MYRVDYGIILGIELHRKLTQIQAIERQRLWLNAIVLQIGWILKLKTLNAIQVDCKETRWNFWLAVSSNYVLVNIKGERWNVCKTAVCLRPFVFHDKDICITSNICCGKDFFAIYFKFVFKIIRSLVKIKSSVFAVTLNEKLKLSLQSSIILWYYLCYIFPASLRVLREKRLNFDVRSISSRLWIIEEAFLEYHVIEKCFLRRERVDIRMNSADITKNSLCHLAGHSNGRFVWICGLYNIVLPSE